MRYFTSDLRVPVTEVIQAISCTQSASASKNSLCSITLFRVMTQNGVAAFPDDRGSKFF
jgi:hypothetical protein